MPLEKVIALQDKYNRENHTYLAVSQIVTKIENGEIKIEE